MKKNKFLIVIAMMILSLFGALAIGRDSYAYSGYQSKALAQSVSDCYKVGAFYPEDITTDQLMNEGANFLVSDVEVGLPYGVSNDKNDFSVSCLDLIFKGTFAPFEGFKNKPTTKLEWNSLLPDLGYHKVGSAGDRKCYRISFKDVDLSESKSTICANYENDKIVLGSINIVEGGSQYVRISSDGSNVVLRVLGGVVGNTPPVLNVDISGGFDELKSQIDNNWFGAEGMVKMTSCDYTRLCVGHGRSNEIEEDLTWRLNETVKGGGSVSVIKSITGTNYGNISDLKFSEEDEYYLYKDYADYYQIEYIPKDRVNNTDGYVEVSDDQFAKANAHQDVTVYGIKDDGFFGKSMRWEEIAKEYFTLKEYAQENNLPTTPGGGTNQDGSGGEKSDDELCYESGVESMSWILCPTMNNTRRTISSIEGFVDGWLATDPDYYAMKDSEGEETGTYIAWDMFRQIANVSMIIFLLVIIFSQLTGFGIDNYGIKKMLPRFIVVAILINLSFWICDLAIDLSNILGTGLKNLFAGMGDQVLGQEGMPTDWVASAVKAIFLAVGIGGTAASTGITVATLAGGAGLSTMGVVLIVVALLAVLVAVLLFFVMLGARVVIVIFCVAVSPVAFVLYIMPNTQKLFKKWWSVFEAALIVYPLCGALLGVSYLIKAIILNISSSAGEGGGIQLWMGVAALLVPYLSFFLLPSLLKNAIGSLGKIGGAVTALGNGVMKGVRGTQSAVKDTDAYKSAAKQGAMNIMRRSVGIGKDGELTARGERKLARARRRGGRYERMYASRLAAIKKDDAEGVAAEASLLKAASRSGIAGSEEWKLDDVTFEAGSESAYYAKQFEDMEEAGDIQGMNSAVEAMRNSGMKDKDVAKVLRAVANKDQFGGIKDSNTRAAWLRDTAGKFGNGFLATDFELREYMRRSGAGGQLGSYGEYAAKNINIDDIKPEDVLRLSGHSIAGLAASGKLTQNMAQRVMAMNPNISEDKKIMLGAIATGHAAGLSVENIDQFKQDVDTLMANHGASGLMTINNVNESMVDAWTSSTPQDVKVVNPSVGSGGSVIGGSNNGGGSTNDSGSSENYVDVNKLVERQADMDEVRDRFNGNSSDEQTRIAQAKWESLGTGYDPNPTGDANRNPGHPKPPSPL